MPGPGRGLDLRVILGLLNSVLLDWYVRLGSTNSKVNEYQFNTLPCPGFRESATPGEAATGRAAVALEPGQPAVAELAVEPLLADAPFSPALHPVIAAAVDRIVTAESNRASISRSGRSALSPAAQPYQDFLDHVYFRLAGLTADEEAGLRTRYEAMRMLT